MAFRLSKSFVLACLPLLGLGACAYGYDGMSVGTGYSGGYSDDYYGPAGNYGGWYNEYYYPGNGYYVFDRGGRRHRWNDRQRNYWEARRQQYRGNDGRRGDDRWRGHDRRNDRSERPTDRRETDGRPVDGRRNYDRLPDRTSDATPGRNWRNRSGERAGPDPSRQNQFRPGRSENRPPPSTGQDFRGRDFARPYPARPLPSVRQPGPRSPELRDRKRSD